jgi:hypothetical protein
MDRTTLKRAADNSIGKKEKTMNHSKGTAVPIAALIGFGIEEIGGGRAVASLLRPATRQPHGDADSERSHMTWWR